MRNLNDLNAWRYDGTKVIEVYGWTGDETCGVFHIPSKTDGVQMLVIASSGEGWDHVSVSRRDRPPNWDEMDYLHKLFFKPDEYAMQLHVPQSEHINIHSYCLHLWRPLGQSIPIPPSILVGPSATPRIR